LTPRGSSAVHIYTQTVHRRTQLTGNRTGRAASLRVIPGICLTTVEKARKNLRQGGRRMPAGIMKTEYAEQNTT
jgi:hypothetical protein